MKNQGGFMTMDFLFAIVLIIGLSLLLFKLSITLTTASVVQYITYSSARNYFAGHADPSNQVDQAEKKYRELIQNPVFKPLLSGGWFEILDKPDVGNISEIRPGYNTQERNQFWGVGTDFTAKLLDLKIPFFGATDPESDGSGGGFTTYLGSYLGREPTSKECWEFTKNRWQAIRNLSVSRGADYSTGTPSNGYVPVEDSGC